VTLVALSALPLLWVAWRLGLLRARLGQALALALTTAALATPMPWSGTDFAYLKRANLMLALAAVALLSARGLGLAWLRSGRRELLALGGLAAASLVIYTNFFSFHGQRTWIHYHDVAHYYLGAKYFGELGYGRLYTAMLRAEAETYGDRFRASEARDLAVNRLVPIAELLRASDATVRRFSPERWQAFKEDVAHLRAALGPHYAEVLRDHGFNPTPVWGVYGGFLANLVPAGSQVGLTALTLIDPLLLIVLLGTIARVFGGRAALLVLTHFCLIFGASFGWVGGAFARYAWLTALGLAVCAVERRRLFLAGLLVGVAAALRVFPAFFTAALVLGIAAELPGGNRRRALASHVLGFVLGLVGLVVPTVVRPGGLEAWAEFQANLRAHMTTTAPNRIGLGAIAPSDQRMAVAAPAAGGPAVAPVSSSAVRWPLFAVAAAAIFVLGATPGLAVTMTLGGIALNWAAVDLAAYYYVFLVLLAPTLRDRPWRLVALLGLELASHALLLFLDEDSIYPLRSALCGWLLLALLWDPVREGLARWGERLSSAAVPPPLP